VVLGHPGYYPRFGIDSEYRVPEEAIMLLELKLEALNGRNGEVKYHTAFHDV